MKKKESDKKNGFILAFLLPEFAVRHYLCLPACEYFYDSFCKWNYKISLSGIPWLEPSV
ncbi:MAG: hypothetical protein ACLUOI_38715 [Eisenbergiella sp.]